MNKVFQMVTLATAGACFFVGLTLLLIHLVGSSPASAPSSGVGSAAPLAIDIPAPTNCPVTMVIGNVDITVFPPVGAAGPCAASVLNFNGSNDPGQDGDATPAPESDQGSAVEGGPIAGGDDEGPMPACPPGYAADSVPPYCVAPSPPHLPGVPYCVPDPQPGSGWGQNIPDSGTSGSQDIPDPGGSASGGITLQPGQSLMVGPNGQIAGPGDEGGLDQSTPAPFLVIPVRPDQKDTPSQGFQE